jgi:hypothetical protein
MLWGAMGVKAARKYVDEIDPGFAKKWLILNLLPNCLSHFTLPNCKHHYF